MKNKQQKCEIALGLGLFLFSFLITKSALGSSWLRMASPEGGSLRTKASLEIENVSVANFLRASMTPGDLKLPTHVTESLEFHLNRSLSPGS